jgi:hypothetical protein
VLLGLNVRPVGEQGRAAARVDAAHDAGASRAPSLKTKTPATVISSIRALPPASLPRSSCGVRSGTHWSLKAISYSAIAGLLCHRQPAGPPLTFSANAPASIRHPGHDWFQAGPDRSRPGPSGTPASPRSGAT